MTCPHTITSLKLVSFGEMIDCLLCGERWNRDKLFDSLRPKGAATLFMALNQPEKSAQISLSTLLLPEIDIEKLSVKRESN